MTVEEDVTEFNNKHAAPAHTSKRTGFKPKDSPSSSLTATPNRSSSARPFIEAARLFLTYIVSIFLLIIFVTFKKFLFVSIFELIIFVAIKKFPFGNKGNNIYLFYIVSFLSIAFLNNVFLLGIQRSGIYLFYMVSLQIITIFDYRLLFGIKRQLEHAWSTWSRHSSFDPSSLLEAARLFLNYIVSIFLLIIFVAFKKFLFVSIFELIIFVAIKKFPFGNQRSAIYLFYVVSFLSITFLNNVFLLDIQRSSIYLFYMVLFLIITFFDYRFLYGLLRSSLDLVYMTLLLIILLFRAEYRMGIKRQLGHAWSTWSRDSSSSDEPSSSTIKKGYQNSDDIPMRATNSESLYSYIKKRGQMLNRIKDIVCLILSYPPMNSVNRGRHEVWIQDVLKINEMVREMEMPSDKKVINSLQISSQISRLLDHSWDDIEAYVPVEIIEKMCMRTLEVDKPVKEVTARPLSAGSGKQEAIPLSQDDREIEMTIGVARHTKKGPMQEKLLNLAADFTVRQILQEIENPALLRIGISGREGVRVTSALMNLTKIRETFDVAILVNGSLHLTTTAVEENIVAQLGLSTWTGPELDELLRGTNFLIVLENIHERLELYKLGTNWWNSKKIQKIVSMTRYHSFQQRMLLDLEICMDNHFLPWELFFLNVGDDVHSSVIQRLAIHAVQKCRGHLLAIVLLARTLKEVNQVHIWEYASLAPTLQPASQMKDEVLFNTLAFICGRLGNLEKTCLKYFVDMEDGEEFEEANLIGRWITCGLIGKLDEGEKIVCNLVDAFLLESSWNGDSIFVQMRGEIRVALRHLFGLESESLFFWLDGKGLTEPPNNMAWEKANEIHLMNNKLSELPKSPDCPLLRALFLQINHHLRVIPTFFFERMPVLQILDLSHTRIRSLPQSLSKLVQLRIFLLRGCRLLMELPPEVGELINLEVLDLEETDIIKLPMSVGKLTNLRSLKVSFYGYNNHGRKNNQSNTMIPRNVISKLLQLEELNIYVNPDDEHWNVMVKDILKDICSFKRLEALKLYLPEVILLKDFMGNGASSINLSLLNFRFIVGSHSKRLISRMPHEVAAKFEQQGQCLKYVNSQGIPVEIKEVLRHTTALIIDRHLTLTKLSDFGIGNIKNLEFCVLGECSLIESIVDGIEIYTPVDDGGVCGEIILGSLQYLRLHYMKNLRSIWKGPIQRGCLSNLKSMELHACPYLTTIFTLDLLENLNKLEELVVEQCPEITSIVTYEAPVEHRQFPLLTYLPKLKKISLHYMPKLVSISSGLPIAPTLEWMSFYDCQSLQTLSGMEASSNNLKVIVGQDDWWRALKWSTSTFGYVLPSNLDSLFVPIKPNIDLMTQLTEIGIQHLAPKRERKRSQQSASVGSMRAPAIEAGITSEEKQLYESVPLPFPGEGGDSTSAPAVEAGAIFKGQLSELASSQKMKGKYLQTRERPMLPPRRGMVIQTIMNDLIWSSGHKPPSP